MGDYKKIIWLASYPKSGNTWFRVFLTNLFRNNNEPADINKLETSPIASSRLLFDEATGLPSSDLTQEEIDELRPEVYLYIAKKAKGVEYQKIHDAFINTSCGKHLIPAEATKGVVYIIRNPLDVCISFANHSAISIDKAIDLMADRSYSFCSKPDKLHNQLRQKLLSWSGHVGSWVDDSNLPLCLIKYEDLQAMPFETFKMAVEFIGLDVSDEQIRKSIKFSEIGELQKQEKINGFNEKPAKADFFFRKGIAGDWKVTLQKDQIDRLTNDHGEVMKRFGYLDIDGI